MIEKVSGERLEKYLHEHIFGPLGMADTSLKVSPSQRERLLAMHARGADRSNLKCRKSRNYSWRRPLLDGIRLLEVHQDGRSSEHRVLMPLPLLCRFSDAGMTRLSTRCGGRRPKSAKARNRGKWGTGGAAGLWRFSRGT